MRDGNGCLVLGLKISNGDAKGWIVLLANGAGSRIDVLVEEFCRRLKPAVGPEGEGSKLEERLAMGLRVQNDIGDEQEQKLTPTALRVRTRLFLNL